MSLPKVTYENFYRGYQIWKDYRANSGCRIDMIDRGIDMLEIMKMRHNRFMFVRWDLHFPANVQYPLSNIFISKFNKKLKEHFTNAKTKTGHRKKVHMEFIWSREHNPDRLNFHVHYAAVFDGNWFHPNNPYGILKGVVEPTWQKVLGGTTINGLVDYCNSERYGGYSQNGIMVDRFDNAAFSECVRWLSYISKISEQTNNIIKHGNSWGSSGVGKSRNALMVQEN